MPVSNFAQKVLNMVMPAPAQVPVIADVKKPSAAEGYARLYSQNPALLSRRTKSQRKLQMFEDDFYALVEELLRKGFHPDNYERLKLTIHTSTNVLKRISRDRAILYEQPAQRTLLDKTQPQTQQGEAAPSTGDIANGEVDPNAVDAATQQDIGTGDPEVDGLAEVIALQQEQEQEEDTPFDRMLKASDWDSLLDGVEQLCESQPVVWVRPVVTGPLTPDEKLDPKTAKLEYVVYTPANAVGVPNPENPAELVAWYYWGEEVYEDGGTQKVRQVIHYYEPARYKKFDTDWKLLAYAENKLGRIPVTAFRIDRPRGSYYSDGRGNDLYQGTLELCLLRTIQNQRAKDSGFKQLVITGADSSDVPQDQVMGGPTPIIIPGGESGAGANVLDLQPNLQQFTDLCRERAKELQDNYGITVDVEQTGAPESGYAKKLRMAKVLKESRRRRKFFAAAEQDLYNNVALTLRAYPVASIGRLDATAELQTDFAEPDFEENPWEQARIDSLHLKLNITSIVDLLRRYNPDLSDAELVRAAYRNKRLNEVLMTGEQVRLTDLLATRAIAGASLDQQQGSDGGAPGGQAPTDGQPPAPGGAGQE